MNIQVKKHSQSEHTRKKGIHSLKLGGGGGAFSLKLLGVGVERRSQSEHTRKKAFTI